MSPIVVMSGGGMKGAVAAARCAKEREVILLHVDHGQPSAASEAKALATLVSWFPRARLVSLDLPCLTEIQRISADKDGVLRTPATGGAGDGARERVARGSPGFAPVLMRGLMPALTSTAVQTALRVGATSVAIGWTQWSEGGHLGLPPTEDRLDRRREFVHAFNIMLDALLKPYTKMQLETPLMDLSDGDVVKLGMRFGVPFEKTWTCTGAGPRPCDQCEPCKARARAFIEAGLPDPAVAATMV